MLVETLAGLLAGHKELELGGGLQGEGLEGIVANGEGGEGAAEGERLLVHLGGLKDVGGQLGDLGDSGGEAFCLEDAGDKVEDSGGSPARKLGRPGRQGGTSAARRAVSCREGRQLQGGGNMVPLQGERLEGVVTVREGSEGAAEDECLLFHLYLHLGGLEDVGGNTRGS